METSSDLFEDNGDSSNLKKPDISTLLNINDTDSLILDLFSYLSEHAGYGESLNNLTAAQRVFYLNQSLESEVNNGGFDQYFFNSSGDLALLSIDALATIGAGKAKSILQSAIDVFPKPYAEQQEERRQLMLEGGEGFSAVWENLDEQFLEYDDNIYELTLEHIRQNIDDF